MLDADAGRLRIIVPSIALVEVVYLIERNRVPAWILSRLLLSIEDPASAYRLVTLDIGTVRSLQAVPRQAVPDMLDRIIVATAMHLGLPLISRDERIRRAALVPVVW
jgi:predicted nucleic acid-binding protein